MVIKKKKDAYETFAGDFKTEDEFEEELQEEGLEPAKVEEEHFEEGREPIINEEDGKEPKIE